jgi:hypothetical protein
VPHEQLGCHPALLLLLLMCIEGTACTSFLQLLLLLHRRLLVVC